VIDATGRKRCGRLVRPARSNPYVETMPFNRATAGTAAAVLAALPSTFPRKQLTVPQAKAVLEAWVKTLVNFDRFLPTFEKSRPMIAGFTDGAVMRIGSRSFRSAKSGEVPLLDAANTVISWAAEQAGNNALDLGAQGWLTARDVAKGERVTARGLIKVAEAAQARADITTAWEMPREWHLATGIFDGGFSYEMASRVHAARSAVNGRVKALRASFENLGSVSAIQNYSLPWSFEHVPPVALAGIYFTSRTALIAARVVSSGPWTWNDGSLTVQAKRKDMALGNKALEYELRSPRGEPLLVTVYPKLDVPPTVHPGPSWSSTAALSFDREQLAAVAKIARAYGYEQLDVSIRVLPPGATAPTGWRLEQESKWFQRWSIPRENPSRGMLGWLRGGG